MLRQAEKGKIDLILTKSISRLARNTVDVLEATRMLKDKGVDMFFENENLKALRSENRTCIDNNKCSCSGGEQKHQ